MNHQPLWNSTEQVISINADRMSLGGVRDTGTGYVLCLKSNNDCSPYWFAVA